MGMRQHDCTHLVPERQPLGVLARLHENGVDGLVVVGLEDLLVERSVVVDVIEDDESAAAMAERVSVRVGILDHDACEGLAVPVEVSGELGRVARRAAHGGFDAVRGQRLLKHGARQLAAHNSRLMTTEETRRGE